MPKPQDCTPSGSISKFSSLHNTSLCTQNNLKHNFSKTQLVNGVQPWFSGLKFILTWPTSSPKSWIVHHLKYFKKFSSFHNTLCTQNDLKQNFRKTQLVNGVQTWSSGTKFILTWTWNRCPKPQDSTPSGSILKNFPVSIILYVF